MTMARINQIAREVVGFILWLGGVILNMAALVWCGFQLLRWLHDGYWTNQPTLEAWMRNYCPDACTFANNPHSWFGVAKLVHFIYQMPSGLALSVLGVICAVLSVSVADHRPDILGAAKQTRTVPF